MGIEWFTGFEGCGSDADVYSLVDGVNSTSTIKYHATEGFAGGKAIYTNSSSISGIFKKNCIAAKTKVTGFHVKGLGTAGYSTSLSWHFLRFTLGSVLIRIFNTLAGLEVYRDSTLIASCAVIVSSAWNHVEVKLVSHASAGSIEIKVNGESVLSATNINTDGADITPIWYAQTSTSDVYYDNVFIADDWQGELKSYLLQPNSDESVQFTPNSGDNNYSRINQAAQDGDTTYVESNTSGHKDLYGYTDIAANMEIKAVSAVTVAKKTDVGDQPLKLIAKQGATEYELDTKYLATAYPAAALDGWIKTLDAAPDASPWTPVILNAIQWGFEI